jgi:metal-responsive CopG/Arc/MetJ family transcriptional regulator
MPKVTKSVKLPEDVSTRVDQLRNSQNLSDSEALRKVIRTGLEHEERNTVTVGGSVMSPLWLAWNGVNTLLLAALIGLSL